MNSGLACSFVLHQKSPAAESPTSKKSHSKISHIKKVQQYILHTRECLYTWVLIHVSAYTSECLYMWVLIHVSSYTHSRARVIFFNCHLIASIFWTITIFFCCFTNLLTYCTSKCFFLSFCEVYSCVHILVQMKSFPRFWRNYS